MANEESRMTRGRRATAYAKLRRAEEVSGRADLLLLFHEAIVGREPRLHLAAKT
jgi:hypothetical protein